MARSAREGRQGRPSRQGATGPVLDGVERWTRLGLGAVGVASAYGETHLAHALSLGHGADEPAPDGPPRTATLPEILPGALLALALAAQGRCFDLVAATELRIGRFLASIGQVGPGGWAARRLHTLLEPWDARWREQQQANIEVAETFLAKVGPGTLDELLARIDVERVVDRVPVDRVLDRIDVNSVVTDVMGDLRYADLIREGTGVLATTTAEVVRGQVTAVSRIPLPFLRRGQAEPPGAPGGTGRAVPPAPRTAPEASAREGTAREGTAREGTAREDAAPAAHAPAMIPAERAAVGRRRPTGPVPTGPAPAAGPAPTA